MGSIYFRCFTEILLQMLLIIKGVLCLRDAYMIIPEAVERGKPVVIKCMYDLENEELYQMKWYRGDREFCRYAPRDVPPLKVFPIRGLEVDREASDAQKVTIKAATKAAEGTYKCEVSADAPSFITAELHGEMHVVDLPKEVPDLIGLKSHYKPGMKLKVECISRNSMPPANLSFFVNSEPALAQHVWHRISGGKNGSLWNAYSTMQFIVQRHHFQRDKIKIRCLAFIYNVYYQSHEMVANRLVVVTTPAPESDTWRSMRINRKRIAINNGTVNIGLGAILSALVTIVLAYKSVIVIR